MELVIFGACAFRGVRKNTSTDAKCTFVNSKSICATEVILSSGTGIKNRY